MLEKQEKKELRFEFENKDYVVKPLSARQLAEGRKVYTKAFKKGIEDGAILKKSLDDHMRRQGLWDDDKQAEYTDLIKKSADLEYRIKSGQFKKASELKQKAFELKKIREETSSLMAVRNSMDSVTAEGLAENKQFNYFVSVSVVDYATQKPVFSSLEDYEDRADSELALTCASKFANYFYELEEDFESTLVENKLLKKLNLLNDKGFLVDRQGRLIDQEGNLINEEGARIDEEGNRIDINNNPLLEDDMIDSLEFEDDLWAEDKKPQPKPKTQTKKTTATKKKTESTA